MRQIGHQPIAIKVEWYTVEKIDLETDNAATKVAHRNGIHDMLPVCLQEKYHQVLTMITDIYCNKITEYISFGFLIRLSTI